MAGTPTGRDADDGSAPKEPALDDIVWHAGDMPYSPRFGDHYYSRADGLAETRHVFLRGNDLPQRWAGRAAFAIGELGFGTGLNFLATWRLWERTRERGQHLAFTSVEAYPLAGAAMARALGAWPELAGHAAALVARWPRAPAGAVRLAADPQTTLTVVIGAAADAIGAVDGPVDAWFLDGFAPASNPDMWEAALMAEIFARTGPGGTFATYSAAGWVRRNLAAAGFALERRRGHAGKRDMTVGRRP